MATRNSTATNIIGRGGISGKLNNLASKRAFVSRQLKVNPRSIGLSKTIAIHPGRGQFYRANAYDTEISGSIGLQTKARVLLLKGLATYRLHFKPAAFSRDITHYLVSATVRSKSGQVRLHASARNERGRGTGFDDVVQSSFKTINLVAERGNRFSTIQLNAWQQGDRWELQKIEITPVRR